MLCWVPWQWHSAKKIKKNKNRLCRVPRRYGTRQRILNKKKILCRVLNSAEKLKKKFKTAWAFGQRPSILCRVPAWHECPRFSTRQSRLYRENVRRSLFAECCTRQKIYRVHGCLALGKACGCCSVKSLNFNVSRLKFQVICLIKHNSYSSVA